MGVRGLTGYIARYAEQYLLPYELHDCNLVIDGDCLACNLYKDYSGAYSAFGGDYDDFFAAIVKFFKVLHECNIKSYVLMDGGYEKRKLRLVKQRMRGKIAGIKRINPCGSKAIFPLMLKEVFIDAVKSCGVPLMRCVFEADQELATLSRKLNCPVLSYDSDFYIYNVLYIPLITLTVKVHTKVIKSNTAAKQGDRTLQQHEVRKLQKRINRHKIMEEIKVPTNNNNNSKNKKENTNNDNDDHKKVGRNISYKYLDCCVYRTEHFIKLKREKLPLFAAMLGNDYISRGSFSKMAMFGASKLGRSKISRQQRRIKTTINWLKHETIEAALKTIMQHLSKKKQAQLLAAIKGYSDEECHSFQYFVSRNAIELNEQSGDSDNECDEISEEIEDNEDDIFPSDDEDDNNDSDKSVDGDFNVNDNNSNDSENDRSPNNRDDNIDDSSDDDDCIEEIATKNGVLKRFPQWFLDKLYPGHLPRFFVDLMYLRKYINNPQIEHYQFNDCNTLALPILIYIFSLLNNPTCEEEKKDANSNINKLRKSKNFFKYFTRQARISHIQCKVYHIKELPKYAFSPYEPNPLLLREIFMKKMPKLLADKLFIVIDEIPKDLQLYFLSISYWLQNSQRCDLIHLLALILCAVVIRTVDSTIPRERDMKMFKKRFGKIIQRESEMRKQHQLTNGCKRKICDDLLKLSIPERMAHVPKSDCYLVQNNLLIHFHMPDIFKKAYDSYSTIVLHSFAEFQAVLYHMNSLNALLDFVYAPTQLNRLYCGVFLYNIYELLKSRPDPLYYVKTFLLRDSEMMFDFYQYLCEWCSHFMPASKKIENLYKEAALSKRNARKKKKRLQQQQQTSENNDQEVNDSTDDDTNNNDDKDDFYDEKNRFCTFF